MGEGHILIVDDNSNNLVLLSGILQDAGHEVRAANSAHRAIRMVERSHPELMLLDIQMPEMDGYDLCALFKADPDTERIPIIFISALDDVFDKVRAFKAGGVDYVVKPFEAEEVVVRVENQLNLARLRQEVERQNLELKRRYDELIRSQRKTDKVFTALSEILPGTVLDETYRLEQKIGEGGFGAVFAGVHVGLNRPVAVKVLRPTSEDDLDISISRFRQEGIAACRVDHPNAVEVLDFRVSPAGIAYLVMELLRGQTLGSELRRHGTMTVERCARTIVPVCEALAEAHSAGIIHRDVKPDNIFLHQTKRGEVVKVLDFGIAKLMEEPPGSEHLSLTLAGQLIGTPSYMSLERLRGDPYDARADVYSIGVIVYQMLAGQLPFGAEHVTLPKFLRMILTESPIPLRQVNPDIGVEIESVVMRALDRDPNARPSALGFATDLRHAVELLLDLDTKSFSRPNLCVEDEQ